MPRTTTLTDALASIWEPDARDRRVSGTFTWNEDGGTARVIGHLQPISAGSFGPGDLVRPYDLLHANLDSVNYTMIGCQEQIGIMAGDEFVPNATINCRVLIAGVLLNTVDDSFAALRFRLDAADSWVGRGNIENRLLWKPRVKSEVIFEVGDPDAAGAWSLTDGVDVRAEQNPQSVRTTKLTTFVYQPDDGVTVKQAIETVHAVERLAALCSGRSAPANEVSLDHPTETRGQTIDGDPVPSHHTLFFKQTTTSGSTGRRRNVPPITLTQLGGAIVLDPWLGRCEELRVVVNMVVADQASEITYLEQRYLSNALGAELLDRHDRSTGPDGDVRTDPERFDALRDKVLAAVDGDDRADIERLMRHANVPPLYERLGRLARTADPDRRWLFHDLKHGRWAMAAADVRNALTHQDGLASDERVKPLYWLNTSVRLVVIANVLAPLGNGIAERLLTSDAAQSASRRLRASVEAFEEYLATI